MPCFGFIAVTAKVPASSRSLFPCRCWYTNLTNTASNCDDFYTDANAITLYKGWVKTIASRVNSITGATYGSDPTIFSWDLINEPRCDDPTSCSATDIQV